MMLTVDELKVLLSCNPGTGELFWKERPPHLFKTDQAARDWNSKYIGTRALKRRHNGYLAGEIWGEKYFAHRVVWALTFGEWPAVIDHINHDRADNRIANLRNVSQLENVRNSRLARKNKSGFHGVRWTGSCWQAYIGLNNKRIDLGYHRELADAIAVRKAKEREFGFHENHGSEPIKESA